MNLEQRINDDLKAAMKSGDKVRIDALRSLRAAIIEFNKSGSETGLTPEIEFKILNGAAKNAKMQLKCINQLTALNCLQKRKQNLLLFRNIYLK
jgi:uncharacterized protein YqeY